jgi:hypothetical protein
MIIPNLPAFLDGKYQPQANDKRLALLGICQFKNRTRTSARLWDWWDLLDWCGIGGIRPLPLSSDGVLRTRTQGTWLDLELSLWRALAEKVKMWGRENGLGPANR